MTAMLIGEGLTVVFGASVVGVGTYHLLRRSGLAAYVFEGFALMALGLLIIRSTLH